MDLFNPSDPSNSTHNTTITIIEFPYQNQPQIPHLQHIQMLQHAQDHAQINQAVQQSINQYQNRHLSRKNGLRKRHYRQIKKMKVGKTNQKCTICIEPFKKNQLINLLPCKHIIHSICCKQWTTFNDKCPVCRFNLTQHFQTLQLTLIPPENQEQNKKIEYENQKQDENIQQTENS